MRTADSEAGPGDPQVDVNVLIRLLQGVPEFVAFAQAQQSAGLAYNLAVQAEFLAGNTAAPAQLLLLEQQYGIQLIRDVSLAEIDSAAARLQAAFHGDPLRRSLGLADARVAATAFLKNEPLATGDLQFCKRLADLAIAVQYVGSGRAAAKAAAYIPQPVAIPGP